MSVCGSRHILGMRVDATSYEGAAGRILAWAQEGRGGMVCCASVHMVMESFDDARFRSVVNGADLVTADGMPLVWALRALGEAGASRVYGPDLTRTLLEAAERAGVPVGFYGGSARALERLVEATLRAHPGLAIRYAWAPPFRPLTPSEDRAAVEEIRASGSRILLVGLGCPKQERWMAEHRERLAAVMVGVGAAFDFLSGVKPQAPKVLQRAGLEWLFRLGVEPARLWKRYLKDNPRFVGHYGTQLLRERLRASR